MTELWRPVVGYESDYLVSDQGNVWSFRNQRCLKQRWLDGRYLAVNLNVNKVQKTKKVHHLVAEAFIGPRPDGLLCLHRDDDRTNNTPANLYWGDSRQNQADCTRNGTRPSRQGVLNTQARLSVADVQEIKRLLAAGWSQPQIAKRFGVTSPMICRINTGKAWAHVA